MKNNQPDIATLMEEMDAGVFAERVARALAETAAAVVDTGKKGKVTITFDIKRISSSQQVDIKHCVKYSLPTHKGSVVEDNTTSTPMYVGVRGYLGIMPQAQMQLEGLTAPAKEEA